MVTVRLGVLASGSGTNLEALLRAHERGDLPCPVAVVISNNGSSGALEKARAHGIPALHVSGRTHEDPDTEMRDQLRAHGVDVVVLAGYMKLLGDRVLSRYPDRVLNIHPGPLPRFGGKGMYGHRVHEAVLAAGVDRSGPTVHLVDARYDEGPVLAHQEVPVLEGDTPQSLAARVQAAEYELYWRVIAQRFG